MLNSSKFVKEYQTTVGTPLTVLDIFRSIHLPLFFSPFFFVYCCCCCCCSPNVGVWRIHRSVFPHHFFFSTFDLYASICFYLFLRFIFDFIFLVWIMSFCCWFGAGTSDECFLLHGTGDDRQTNLLRYLRTTPKSMCWTEIDFVLHKHWLDAWLDLNLLIAKRAHVHYVLSTHFEKLICGYK